MPAVNANAGIATATVLAGRTVLAGLRQLRAFVHVFCAVDAHIGGRTLARVGIDAVDASGAILTLMADAIVNVYFTSLAGETGWTIASGQVTIIWIANASAAILAVIRRTGNVQGIAVLTRVT